MKIDLGVLSQGNLEIKKGWLRILWLGIFYKDTEYYRTPNERIWEYEKSMQLGRYRLTFMAVWCGQ